MHCAPADGQRELHPLLVAGPLHGIPCSSRHSSGSISRLQMRSNDLTVFTLRVRLHSSQTVELPAPMNDPFAGSWALPCSTCTTRSITAAIWCDSGGQPGDRKSTRLNSSHGYISYAVFCL